MAKPLSFKDFLVVDYTPGMPEEISWAAMKRRRGRIGEEVEGLDEDLEENLRKQVAQMASKFPEGSKVKMKHDGKVAKVLSVGKDFVKVSIGNKTMEHKPSELERIREEVEETDEALNFAQRRARGRVMRKNKAKIAMGRRKAANRAADPERLKKRARKQAMNVMFKKLAKGTSRADLPATRRQEIEKRLEKLKPRIDKMSRKLLPQVRKMEKERRMGKQNKDA